MHAVRPELLFQKGILEILPKTMLSNLHSRSIKEHHAVTCFH